MAWWFYLQIMLCWGESGTPWDTASCSLSNWEEEYFPGQKLHRTRSSNREMHRWTTDGPRCALNMVCSLQIPRWNLHSWSCGEVELQEMMRSLRGLQSFLYKAGLVTLRAGCWDPMPPPCGLSLLAPVLSRLLSRHIVTARCCPGASAWSWNSSLWVHELNGCFLYKWPSLGCFVIATENGQWWSSSYLASMYLFLNFSKSVKVVGI